MYKRLWKKCNVNCNRAPKTNLNVQLAIETEAVNIDLNRKEEIIIRKLKYLHKMWEKTDYPMDDQTYEKKLNFFMARNLKIQFIRLEDQKFRHSPQKFQWFFTYLPVIMVVLNKEENQHLKEFLFGLENIDFEFSPEWIESKMEFMHHQGRNLERTEKVENTEFNHFLTTCDIGMAYSLGDEDHRQPLRDGHRL